MLFQREPPLGGAQPVLLDVALNRFGKSRAGIRLLRGHCESWGLAVLRQPGGKGRPLDGRSP